MERSHIELRIAKLPSRDAVHTSTLNDARPNCARRARPLHTGQPRHTKHETAAS